MPDLTPDIAELERLLAEVAAEWWPVPWHTEISAEVARRDIHAPPEDGWAFGRSFAYNVDQAAADLMVAAVNALPFLLAEARKVEGGRLREVRATSMIGLLLGANLNEDKPLVGVIEAALAGDGAAASAVLKLSPAAQVETLTKERDRARAENERLRAEAKPGQMPHRCFNAECSTIQYGGGYDACPGCGGTDGRAALEGAAP